MTETDDGWPEILRGYCTTVHGIDKPDCGKVAMSAAELRAVATKIERQSTALTASQETIDNLRDENERLRKALEEAEGRLDGYEMDVRERGER